MNYQNFENQVQRAFQAYLKTLTFDSIPAENIYKGIERPSATQSADVEPRRLVPAIICTCQQAEAEANYSGSWNGTAVISIQMSADDTDEDTFHAQCAQVYDAIITDTIAADLTSAMTGNPFTAQMVVPKSSRWSIQERTWVKELTLEVHGAAVVIT